MAGADSARIQHEFSPAKSIFMLALIIGCFAILWPKIFHPMIQATFMKKTASVTNKDGDSVCCDVIYENKIDFKFFAELCKSVIEREMATDAGIRKHRMEKYPPPGMLERCRKKIQEVCDIDISEALMKTKRGSWISKSAPTSKPPSKYRKDDVQDDVSTSKPKLNLTECLEKHFQLDSSRRSASRRWTTPTAAHLPSHIRQERPLQVGPAKLHPALREKGNPFPQFVDRVRPVTSTATQTNDRGTPDRYTTTALRPGMGVAHSKPGPSKGVGAMSLLMPIYTVGIVVFFLYSMSKMLMRTPDWRPDTKIIEYHSDPEYRSYLTRHKYDKSGKPLTYKEFLRRKEDDERKKSAITLLGGKGRKQVFTAIEGIIAEMDEYRERVKAEQCQKTNTDEDEIANGQINHSSVVHHVNDVSKDKLEDELARISALEVMEEVKLIDEQPAMDANEVPNIVLEGSMPPDAKILVAESECLTHTTTEHIDGWSDVEDQPVVVTGKMTISLVGNSEATVRSTETKNARETPVRCGTSPTPEARDAHSLNTEAGGTSSPERRTSIEKLANALVDDVFRNQVPRLMEKSPSRNTASGPKKQFSRESVSSQSSSFEYVSASQDEPNLQTPIPEEETVGVDGDEAESDVVNGRVTFACDGVNTETIFNSVEDKEAIHDDGGDGGGDSRDQTPEVDEIGRFN